MRIALIALAAAYFSRAVSAGEAAEFVAKPSVVREGEKVRK